MFNIVILGCKKTLVEYRGWVNRNRYYIRIPIRMGGLFSRNDFVQRLTRPEYFPIATSPQNPTPKPFLPTIQIPLPLHTHTSPPQIPHKIISLSKSKSKISHNSLNNPRTLPFLSPFIYTFSKNPLNSPKIPLNQTKNSSFIPKFLKNQQNSHQKIIPKSPLSHIYTSKQLQKHLSKNLTNSPI